MNYISVAELNCDILKNLYKIPKDVDVIIGIPRSGMLVAILLSLYLNKPISSFDYFLEGKIYSVGKTKETNSLVKDFSEIKKALIVEDSSYSGSSIVEAKVQIDNNLFRSNINCIWLAAYVTWYAKDNVDIYFRKVSSPRVFEWNMMHHKELLVHSCLDVDGVLCFDPTDLENDDGKEYRYFLLNAKPKYIPTDVVGWLVTSRLEKYRTETELWLHKNNVKYNHLIMMGPEFASKAKERQALGNHGKFKADVYKSLREATCFIESDFNQASEIAKLTGKDVICVRNSIFFKGNLPHRTKEFISNGILVEFKFLLKRIVPRSIYKSLRSVYRYSKKIIKKGFELNQDYIR